MEEEEAEKILSEVKIAINVSLNGFRFAKKEAIDRDNQLSFIHLQGMIDILEEMQVIANGEWSVTENLDKMKSEMVALLKRNGMETQ